MTRVNYSKDLHRMEIKGHAGSAPCGEDLVCAAVSILSFQLMAAASDYPEYNASYYLNDLDGVITVECNPDEDYEERCEYMFEVILTGFEVLAGKYPMYVSIGG